MRTFYRVETVDLDDDKKTRGGYMAAATALLCRKLEISPDCTGKELMGAVKKSGDSVAKALMGDLAYLCDIPIPEIYKENQDNLYCLYTYDGFEEAECALEGIDDKLLLNMPRYSLRCKRFDIEDDEIMYEDENQIVISEDTYRKHNTEHEHEYLSDILDGFEEYE